MINIRQILLLSALFMSASSITSPTYAMDGDEQDQSSRVRPNKWDSFAKDPRDHNQMIQKDEEYRTSVGHCPDSVLLRQIIWENAQHISDKTPFDFMVDGTHWKALYVQVYSNEPLEEILKLPLGYNGDGGSWAFAQFFSKDRNNKLVIRLQN